MHESADLVPEAEAKPSPSNDLPPMGVLRAARAWAEVHGHQSPDDRLVSLIFAAGRAQAATDIRQAIDWYPEDVFPPDSEDRNAIAGTAMRHAYEQAAQIAEGTGVADQSNTPEEGA